MARRNNRKEEDSAPDRAGYLAPMMGQTDLTQVIESLFRGFDTSLSQFFPSVPGLSEGAPTVDLIDHGSHYTLTGELPGFTKEEVDVRVDEHALELKAERKDQKESKNEDYVRRKRTRSVFHRLISIPEGVSSSKISGTMKNCAEAPEEEARLRRERGGSLSLSYLFLL